MLKSRTYRLILVLTFLSGGLAYGQTLADITGEVTDSSGAAMPGAAVTVTNMDTGVTRRVVTNMSGVYSFPALQPGLYEVRAEKSGFQVAVRGGVQLQVQQIARIDFHMQVGSVSEILNVSGAAPLLTTESATTGTVIETKRIVELPLNGRNFLQLVALSPNVSAGFGSAGQQVAFQGGQRSQQNISISGQRSEFNHFTLDGIENTDPNFNSIVLIPSIDALQEFKVQTGVYPAEFGRAISQINVSTKSGTNAFHGALFEFLRNDNLDANSFAFTPARPTKPPFVRNQYGFTLGGPVRIPKLFDGRNRLFFLANYEALRDRKGAQILASVPTAAMRAGDFSGIVQTLFDPSTRVRSGGQVVAQPFAGNVVPTSRFSEKSRKLLEFYLPPNVPGAGLARNYTRTDARRQDSDQITMRGDFAESSASNWFGRWSRGDEFEVTPSTFPDQGMKLVAEVNQAMLSNTRVLSPFIVNEFRFGYNGFQNSNLNANAFVRNVVGELGGIPGIATPVPVLYGIPAINITGFTGFGDSAGAPNLTNSHAFQWIDNMSIIRGRHSFRFGAEIRRERYNQEGNALPRGDFVFTGQATQNPSSVANTGSGMADYLLGQIRTSNAALGVAVAQLRATRQYYYLDDTWKIRPNLTLSAGIRYEFSPPYRHKHGGLVNVELLSMSDPSRRPTLVRAGSGDFYEDVPFRFASEVQTARDGRMGERLVRSDHNDFAPRLGLAYSPTEKVTIRAGLGVFYTQDIGNARYDMSRNLAARRNETSNNDFPNLTLDAPFANLGSTIVVGFPQILANNFNRRTPYVIQYLFNVQRLLTKNTIVEAGYAGNQGHKIERFVTVNVPVPGPGAVQARRAFPELGLIQQTDGVVNSNYHSLAAKFQQQFSHGFTALVSHTFSKAIDGGSAIRIHDGDPTFPQDTNNVRGEQGLANFHQRHRFVTSLLWEPPLGKGGKRFKSGVGSIVLGNWQIGSIFTHRTGLPFTATNGVDDANVGRNDQRPNRTALPLDPPGGKDPARYFNPAAFSRIPQYTFGNVGRNTLIGPELFSWDFSAMKRFVFPMEGHELQFRFEAFNFPNRPNFAIPSANLSSSAFGTISGTVTTMRELQFSLKYVF